MRPSQRIVSGTFQPWIDIVVLVVKGVSSEFGKLGFVEFLFIFVSGDLDFFLELSEILGRHHGLKLCSVCVDLSIDGGQLFLCVLNDQDGQVQGGLVQDLAPLLAELRILAA